MTNRWDKASSLIQDLKASENLRQQFRSADAEGVIAILRNRGFSDEDFQDLLDDLGHRVLVDGLVWNAIPDHNQST